MTTETMTINEALAVKKNLMSRIATAVRNFVPAVPNKHINSKIDGLTVEDWRKHQAERYQSISDMIRRRDAITCAIAQSNAVTKVTVGKREYTVAEAIAAKNDGMSGKVALRDRIASVLSMSELEVNRRNGDDLEARADTYIKNTYGGQTDLRNLTEDIRRDRADYIARQSYDLVMPAGMQMKQLLQELDEEINTFMTGVDFALTNSNATTTITITY